MISVDADSQLLQVSNRKGKHESINKVPKLIDQKESSQKKNSLVAQHDKLLFKEVKEQASFQRELSDSFKQSNDNFLKAIDN